MIRRFFNHLITLSAVLIIVALVGPVLQSVFMLIYLDVLNPLLLAPIPLMALFKTLMDEYEETR